MELVSVVMPVWRAQEEIFKQAVQSILDQDYKNLELIVVEDPSEITQVESIKQFADERIRYFLNSERTGFARQINKAIELARGEILARMDADDVARSDRLRRQYDFLQENLEIDLVGSNLEVIDEQGASIGERIYPEQTELVAQEMCMRNAVAHPTIMMRRKVLGELGGYSQEFDTLADYDLWAKMIGAGKKFYNIQEPLLKYRMHQGATKSYFLKKQLQDTIYIKKKYFRQQSDWSNRAEVRYWAEQLLRLLPGKLIYWLFLKINIKK